MNRYLRALALREAGKTFKEIGQVVGLLGPVSPTRASQMVKRGERIKARMEAESAENANKIDRVKKELDRAIEPWLGVRSDIIPRAVQIIVSLRNELGP